MTIAASAQPAPITSPNVLRQFVNKEDGTLSGNARIALQQMHDYVQNIARQIPTNAATTSNNINLTLLDVQPNVTQYGAFDTYGFVADASSTGNVTAQVQTASGLLATLPVYKDNGATQAGNGDITQGLHYWATFVDSLNSGAGGFVLR